MYFFSILEGSLYLIEYIFIIVFPIFIYVLELILQSSATLRKGENKEVRFKGKTVSTFSIVAFL